MGNIVSTLCGCGVNDTYQSIGEKRPLLRVDVAPVPSKHEAMNNGQPAAQARQAIEALIRGDERPLRKLNSQLSHSDIRCTSLAEGIAQGIFESLVDALQPGRPIGNALQEVYDRVRDSALRTFELAKDHPYITIGLTMIVALGILMLIAPWVICYLGFTEEGVAAGSWAAEWQSTYGGIIRSGSIFSWLQRIGAKGLDALLQD